MKGITFLVIFTEMTLLFQKSNFITFLEVTKLLITNYFSNVILTDKVQTADHKKWFQLKQLSVYQFATCL